MAEADTGVKGIKSIRYGSIHKCEIHAYTVDNKYLCGMRETRNTMHAGYSVHQVTCKRCLKKLKAMEGMKK